MSANTPMSGTGAAVCANDNNFTVDKNTYIFPEGCNNLRGKAGRKDVGLGYL